MAQYHMTTAIMSNSKDRGDSGYRALKPKAQMSSVKSDNAFDLMMQMMQFETDLGEVGVQLNSEGAYRQLKAQCVGLARDTLDYALVQGEGIVRGCSNRYPFEVPSKLP